MTWPFDQGADVAAITTRFVLDGSRPILNVAHYSDDHSWAFTCGTTIDPADGRVISMGEAVNLDSTIAEIANLSPARGAARDTVGGPWNEYPLSDAWPTRFVKPS